MAKATKRTLSRNEPREDDGLPCGKNQVRFRGRPRSIKAGNVETGLFFKRLLWHAAENLGLSGPEKLRRIGIITNNLDAYKDCHGGDVRRRTVVTVCLRTQMWASELARPEDAWAAAIDDLLRNKFSFAPASERSLRTQLGESWQHVRTLAARDADDSVTDGLARVSADPLVTAIHQMISANELRRGEEIDVMHLVRQFDEKPSHVTAALQQLALRRLVSTNASRDGAATYQVASVTTQEGREMMLVRSILEGALLAQIMGNRRSRLRIAERMSRSLEAMREALSQDKSQTFINHDIEFHLALAYRKPFIADLLDDLMSAIHTAVPGIPERKTYQANIVQEHEAIVKALHAGYTENAVTLLQRHILSAGKALFG